MRRFGWLILGLGLALAPGLDRPSAAADTPAKVGVGPAYEAAGQAGGDARGTHQAARHHGARGGQAGLRARDDQAARRQGRGRRDVGARGRVLRLVGPPRLLGRPADHPGRLPPAEALLLAGAIEERLGAIAAKETTSPADRAAAEGPDGRSRPLGRRPVEVRPPGEAVGRGPDGDRSAGRPAGRGPPLDVRPRARGRRRRWRRAEGPLREVVPRGGGRGRARRERPHRGRPS